MTTSTPSRVIYWTAILACQLNRLSQQRRVVGDIIMHYSVHFVHDTGTWCLEFILLQWACIKQSLRFKNFRCINSAPIRLLHCPSSHRQPAYAVIYTCTSFQSPNKIFTTIYKHLTLLLSMWGPLRCWFCTLMMGL